MMSSTAGLAANDASLRGAVFDFNLDTVCSYFHSCSRNSTGAQAWFLLKTRRSGVDSCAAKA